MVRFIQETFHNRRDTAEVEIERVPRDRSRLEYDFQSRPIEMLNSHSRPRKSQSDNKKQLQYTYQADTSSDEELSSTEHLHTDQPKFTKRKRKSSKRKGELKDQLIFGIEI